MKHKIKWNLSVSTGCRFEFGGVWESRISAKLHEGLGKEVLIDASLQMQQTQ